MPRWDCPKWSLDSAIILTPNIRHPYGLWTKIQTLQPELKALPDLMPTYLWVWFSNVPSSCYKSVHSQNTFSTSIILLGRRIESELWRKSIWIQDLASPLTQDFSRCHQDVFWRESRYNWLMDCKRGIRENESKERPRFLAWDVQRTKAPQIPRGEQWEAGEGARWGVQLWTPDIRVSIDMYPSGHSSAIISFEWHHKFCLPQQYPSLLSSGHCFLPCRTVEHLSPFSSYTSVLPVRGLTCESPPPPTPKGRQWFYTSKMSEWKQKCIWNCSFYFASWVSIKHFTPVTKVTFTSDIHATGRASLAASLWRVPSREGASDPA